MALADCTGHGVPGSFMTLLGINLLNSIVLEQRIFNPGTILDELDKKLIAALPRANGEENMSDEMEITICVIDHRNQELSYACAGSRFLIYESNSFTMYKGDTKHIGDKPITGFTGYITHVTKLYSTSTMFLFTDGFQDQFGGTKDKKYSFRRMLELFEANIRLPLSEQEKMIEHEFESWRAGEVQTDDISIVSVRRPSAPFVQRYSE
jgi:serine phosphatase RsbU (regulator of sigma subunit)